MRPYRRSAARAVLLCLLAQASPTPVSAAELEGLDAPERITLDDRELRLNGIGVREATRFLITANIYVAALWLQTPSTRAEEVLGSDGLKQIAVRYLYEIDQPDMKRAWAYSFEQNCPDQDCTPYEAAIEQFSALVDAVAPGDTYTYRFFPDRVEILRPGSPAATVPGERFAKLLLSTWLGPSPPTEELKQALLTGP